jgi:hypothetical protein
MFRFRRNRSRRTLDAPVPDPPHTDKLTAGPTDIDLALLEQLQDGLRSELDQRFQDLLREVADKMGTVTETIRSEMADLVSSLTSTVTPPSVPEATNELDSVTFDLSNPDERYASIIQEYIGRAPSTASNGELVNLTILGQLRDGSIAWQNEDNQTFGTLTREMLGDMSPLADDRVRARVVSYPWGHKVIGVVPDSLISPFATRPVPDFQSVSSVAGDPPESIVGTPLESLRPGDLVLARVPYDGTGRLDRHGNTGKARPSVFIRWERDYAVLRAIYDRHGYVANNDLGMGLVDTRALDKPSVVRNTEYDIDPRNITRRLGRLGPRDLHALHIEESPDEPDRSQPLPIQTTNPQAISMAPTRIGIDPVAANSAAIFAAVASKGGALSAENLLDHMLHEMRAHPVISDVLRNAGIHHAMVGHVFAELLKSRGMNTERGLFRHLFDRYMENAPQTGTDIYVTRRDENNHPVLTLIDRSEFSLESGAISGQDDTFYRYEDLHPRLLLDDDYIEPDVIIYDQQSMSVYLQDRRIQLDEALTDLRAGGEAPGYIMGSDAEPALAQFHHAARQRGWKSKITNDRRELSDAALRVATECDAGVVTLVGVHQDVLAELENSGYEVNFVCMLDI